MMYWIGPPGNEGFLAECERNLQAVAERIERNPWVHELRRVRAEVERTDDQTLFVDFQRRFKRAERERWPSARWRQ
jgi:hypothetical protein